MDGIKVRKIKAVSEEGYIYVGNKHFMNQYPMGFYGEINLYFMDKEGEESKSMINLLFNEIADISSDEDIYIYSESEREKPIATLPRNTGILLSRTRDSGFFFGYNERD